MTRILIGALVGTVIFFMLQGLMWEGGIHKDLWQYSPKQDSMWEQMKSYNLSEGLYVFPAGDPKMDHKQQHEMYMKNIGKPWAMLFYHPSMHDEDASMIIMGALQALVACLIASLVLYYGNFRTFISRFLTAFAFGLFTVVEGIMPNHLWWGFPHSFIMPSVIDMTLVWGVASIWLAFYVKKKQYNKSPQ